jgi:uncharacterized protein YbjT (DUF2867 family)
MNVIVTGATGMVGEGVLHECLNRHDIDRVLVVNRKPCGLSHPKLKEVIHGDFLNFSSIESHLTGYDACFFCLGVSSVGMNEADYARLTYDLTMHVASTLAKLNRDMTFIYISGAGTDSSEKGRMMWARVKGKTENDLRKLPFKKSFAFRPGFIEPTKGLKNTLKLYKYLGWIVPIVKTLSPGSILSLKEIGAAMVSAVKKGYSKDVLEISDIKTLAKD